MKTLLIIASLLLFSCGPSAKLRRAEHLIKQAELQGAKWHQDTVYKEVITKGDSVKIDIPIDRIFLIHDTVLVHGPVRLHYRLLHDTLRLTAECTPDTIKVPVTVYKSIVAPPCPKGQLWKGVGFGAGGLLILLILFALARLLKA